MYRVVEGPVSAQEVVAQVRPSDAHGALVTFVGSLRGRSADGRQVLRGRCHTGQGSGEGHLARIEADIRARWHLEAISLCHRIGDIAVGDTVFVAAVAAPHRPEAFAACQYAIDRVKEVFVLEEEVAEGGAA